MVVLSCSVHPLRPRGAWTHHARILPSARLHRISLDSCGLIGANVKAVWPHGLAHAKPSRYRSYTWHHAHGRQLTDNRPQTCRDWPWELGSCTRSPSRCCKATSGSISIRCVPVSSELRRRVTGRIACCGAPCSRSTHASMYSRDSQLWHHVRATTRCSG